MAGLERILVPPHVLKECAASRRWRDGWAPLAELRLPAWSTENHVVALVAREGDPRGRPAYVVKIAQVGGGAHLVREMRMLGRLRGAAVPRVPPVLHSAAGYFMQRYEGPCLVDCATDFDARTRLLVLAAVAETLAAAHAANLFHGDVKPVNIVVGLHGGTGEPEPFLVDWESGGVGRESFAWKGTPRYRDPLSYAMPFDAMSSDVFCMGLTVDCVMFHGGLPMADSARAQITRLHRQCRVWRTDARPSMARVARALGRIAAWWDEERGGDPPLKGPAPTTATPFPRSCSHECRQLGGRPLGPAGADRGGGGRRRGGRRRSKSAGGCVPLAADADDALRALPPVLRRARAGADARGHGGGKQEE